MSQIFDDEETNFNRNLNTNNEYAKNYSKWRIKEEQNRLRAKYGEGIEDESSSSSDEDGVEITTALEKGFFQALACLKNKDPRIYDENVQFFKPCKTMSTEKKKKDPIRNKPIYLKDYERNIILEQGGIPIDEGEFVDEAKPRSPTYVEEQKQLKEGFQNILNDIDEEEEWGGIFKQRQKSKEEAKKEEDEYKNWLAGQEVKLKDKKEEIELKPLKDYWNKADLDESEKFLKDFILNQRFLDPREGNDVPTYDEIIHDSDGDPSGDEENIEKQDEFEHKYNFRFEEPDHEFMKRFPRTLDNSLRQKDVRRKVKRMELKERKKKEKSEKMQELKHLQELKRQEIEEKLKRLKEITGNTSLGFKDDDIDGEFDPEEHDRKMQDLFNNEFYSVEDGGQKPLFPELDEELEIENWDHYSIENEEDNLHTSCGDEDNMDCDNNPQTLINETHQLSKTSGKKRKRKSKFADALSKPKPKYDPNIKDYEKYFDEYYKLNCEDVIGDIPCRFKYRQVVPNDFGLSTEEILFANERELNKWCSLKKSVQIRPDHVEKYDQIAYKKKAQNINLKKRIFPSLFFKQSDEASQFCSSKNMGSQKIIKKKEPCNSRAEQWNINKHNKNDTKMIEKQTSMKNTKKQKSSRNGNEIPKNKQKKLSSEKKNKKEPINDLQILLNKKRKRDDSEATVKNLKILEHFQHNKPSITDARLIAYGINPKRFKNKLKYEH